MKNTALITGATAGIGEAVALKLAALGFNLILTGRRSENLEKVRKEILQQFDVEVLNLCFDIRERDQVHEHLGSLESTWKTVDVLVNNAGLAAGLDLIHEGDMDDWDQMIDTNIKGLLYATRVISPGMVKRNKGHIINIGSIAGKEVYEKGAVYCSTKFAVDALTKGMRLDLVEHGIKVTAINPGMVETEFSMVRFKGDKAQANGVYRGLEPLLANDIAEAVEFAVTRPPHVNINDMLIMPTAQAGAWKTHRTEK